MTIPDHWVHHFLDHPSFEAAINLIVELAKDATQTELLKHFPFIRMVTTACCTDDTNPTDTSVLAVNATLQS